MPTNKDDIMTNSETFIDSSNFKELIDLDIVKWNKEGLHQIDEHRFNIIIKFGIEQYKENL